MTPEARLAAAISLLEAIEAEDRPADRIAAGWLRARRYIGAKDRRALQDRVFRIIRRRAALDWWLERVGAPAPSARLRAIADLLLGGETDAAGLGVLFAGGRHGPAPLDPRERALAAALAGNPLDHPDMPAHVRANCPAWLAPYFERRFGPAFAAELAALNAEAPVDLRVNTLKASREEALELLRADGIAAEPTPISPLGIRIAGRRPLGATAAFARGIVEIQDESSQIVALVTGARPGERVADFCAGGGGKTLALAAAMENRGEIAALDTSPRLMRARPRLARAGVAIATLHRLAGPHDPWLSRREGGFDRVLVDAPCTGTGAWRRDPAARWRLSPARLAEAAGLQREILMEAAVLVRPGGRLVYAICSLLCEEGEDQVTWFRAARPDFAVRPVAAVWAEELGGACPCGGDFLLLTPARHGTDGFFAAVLERGR